MQSPGSDQSLGALSGVLAQDAITNYHRLDGLNQQSFLIDPEAGKSEIKVPTDPESGEYLLPGLQMAACILSDGEQRRSKLSCTFS